MFPKNPGKKPLIAVVGPTGVGKSALALKLAERFSGEVVNADSRQVYKYMDIGTAKPSPQDRRLIPHHLLDVVEPDREFNLAIFLDLAKKAIGEVQGRGKLPILVGGSGQYVWGLLEGWCLPAVAPDPDLRRSLVERARREGPESLYRELQRRDPQAAARIDPSNLRRVLRALEVCHLAGRPFSSLRDKRPPPFEALVLGLTMDRRELYLRLDRRVEAMIQRGWIEEVRGLLDRGYSLELPSLSSLGYRELGLYLQGQLSLEEAIRRIKHATHRLARHQYAWFRLHDPRIRWLEAGGPVLEQASRLVQEFLGMVELLGAE